MTKKRKIDELESNNSPENSTTAVGNVKVKFIRPKYNNLKEWINDENNVYVGRAGVVFVDGKRFPPQASIWANPFKIGKDGNRDKVLEKYDHYITKKIADENLEDELMKLKGKNLGCWCIPNGISHSNAPLVCHGQILLNLLNK